MNMAKSTYYFEINKTDLVAIRNEELLIIIKEIFLVNKARYGVRRVYMELKNRGYDVNHKRVQCLMHNAGLLGKRSKEKYHSYKGEVGKVADNVINRDSSTLHHPCKNGQLIYLNLIFRGESAISLPF